MLHVANRVAEILENSNDHQWRYVPTKENPADDASSGLYGSDISSEMRPLGNKTILELRPLEDKTIAGRVERTCPQGNQRSGSESFVT